MTVSAGLDSRLVTGRYMFKHSPQDGLDKVLAAYGKEERTLIKKKKKFSSGNTDGSGCKVIYDFATAPF